MIVRALAAVALVAILWSAFRLAMGLREAKLTREQARRSQEARGRRVVAEVPDASGDVRFFLADAVGFEWRGRTLSRAELTGARMLLNGAVVAAWTKAGTTLPPPPAPEEFEGRERWEVRAYLGTRGEERIPCGSLREGVSRDVARSVFEALQEAGPGSPDGREAAAR